MQKTFKVAMCQTKVVESKVANINEAYKYAKLAKQMKPDVLVFSEYFTNLIALKIFPGVAEKVEENKNIGFAKQLNEIINQKQPIEMEKIMEDIHKSNIPAYLFLKALSYDLDLLVVGGSIVESQDDKLYNSCYVFDKGELLGKHRKIHLFDIDIPGKITFKESETISAGNQATLIKTRFGNFGIGICYDIRFANYAMYLRELGADVLIYPSVFNQETGPRHFLLSGQARALDTQCYVLLGSSAEYKEKPEFYQAFGHSAIIDCDGKVTQHLSKHEGLLLGEVNLGLIEEIRRNIPYTSDSQKRLDIYGFKNI